MSNEENILAYDYCRYFKNGCLNGTKCFRQHGRNDTRNVCLECDSRRCGILDDGTMLEYCKPCYRTWKLSSTVRKEKLKQKKHVRMNECSTHHVNLTKIKGSKEKYCQSCEPSAPWICGEKNCDNLTARNSCLECRSISNSYTVVPCRKCNTRVYPGERHRC